MVENNGTFYEVLSPWAEADPISFRPISLRINDLSGKKIGLFGNIKRVTEPIMKTLEDRLKKQYPGASVSRFINTVANESITEQSRKGEFERWLEGVDTVIAAYGD